MQPIVAALFVERSADSARFALQDGWQCRVFVLANDLVRVLFVPPQGLREPRTWMVAPNGAEVPWEGRDRLDVAAFERPAFDVQTGEREVVLQTPALRVAARLDPFRLEWSVRGTARFAADRPPSAYQWSPKSGALRHFMVRQSDDRYFGLGDRTGLLDKHGRRLRTLALDALGYDAETRMFRRKAAHLKFSLVDRF